MSRPNGGPHTGIPEGPDPLIFILLSAWLFTATAFCLQIGATYQ